MFSKQKTQRHTFVHTITVRGVVYILRFQRLEPTRFAVTCHTGSLPPFEIWRDAAGWQITGNIPYREQFEALLQPRLDEEVG